MLSATSATELSGAMKDLLRPLHRRIAGTLPLGLRRRYLYVANRRRLPRLRDPRTFTEKVNWRILHDRRPGIAERCDKMRMKEIAADAVPDGSLRIPRTLWHGTDVREVPEALWEGRWVLKPNHGCGDVILGPDPRSPDELHAVTVPWLRDEQSVRLGEWGYSQARREILLEERLPGDGAPADYKIHCFDGRPAYTHVEVGRFGGTGQRGRTFYDNRWRRMPMTQDGVPNPEVPRPACHERMLGIAARLAAGWDYMRVDLYAIDGEIWFGELSPYPGGGVGSYDPVSFDAHLGSLWTLPEEGGLPVTGGPVTGRGPGVR